MKTYCVVDGIATELKKGPTDFYIQVSDFKTGKIFYRAFRGRQPETFLAGIKHISRHQKGA